MTLHACRSQGAVDDTGMPTHVVLLSQAQQVPDPSHNRWCGTLKSPRIDLACVLTCTQSTKDLC
jgi:hypothetical protein